MDELGLVQNVRSSREEPAHLLLSNIPGGIRWLRKFDDSMEGRKVLLWVDNAPPHLKPEELPELELRNTRVEYFPPNVTSVLQPLDAGAMAQFKAAYKRKYLSLVVARPSGTRKPYFLNQREGMEIARWAWDQIRPENIRKYWLHTGILAKRMPDGEISRLTE